jgi:integrase
MKILYTNIDKEQMTDFLHEMMSSTGNLRMQVLTMLLVSSGVRVGEALQIKVENLNFEANPPRINLPAEITKTGVERDVYLTREMVQILKNWIQYKYRDRTIVKRLNGKPVKQEYVKPANIDEFDLNNYRSLYDAFRSEFTKLVNEIFIKKNNLGKKFANGRNSISFHSLRWFVRTSVKEATNDEALACYWVGKENVKYEFDATGKKLLDKYKLIEPVLTFLDPKIITKIGEGHQAEIDHLKKQMELKGSCIH